jgi:hypothetical protein
VVKGFDRPEANWVGTLTSVCVRQPDDASAVKDVLNCNVHCVDFPAVTLDGEQANELKEKAGTTVSVELVVEEPTEAVTVPAC